MAPQLPELASLTIHVLIDNELDPISPSPNPLVEQSGGMKTIGLNGPDLTKDSSRPGAARELRMDHICCSAHGLSLLITGTSPSGESHTVLFDTGPEDSAFERNALRLKPDLGAVETIQLSHWHRDHSGGMLQAISMIQSSKPPGADPVRVDLHPSRPTYRGLQPPGLPVVSLEPDPTFEAIEQAGGVVEKHDVAHTVAGGAFMVSGEIPRVTPYERGLRFGVRYVEGGGWVGDEEMADERFLMCRLKGTITFLALLVKGAEGWVLTLAFVGAGKGLVMFTGCSHAGVVNAARHTLDLEPDVPLYAVMGGFHLADAEGEQIAATAQDLKALGVKVLLAGHCTGWRAKFEIQKVMGEGGLVPSFVGSTFVL
ncbi:uncharacterized protein LTR77_004641 [Saxophila tyrrhenica]|uniref:Metallo-beta-lactamase superfamily protein n=1 Tax=Saxophila tyrrhenica TaxID=1690608 RepID=A0AAV9PDM2_9PEZI|nr:hypothetical protein LTR77_004641 [Saxophila tyrrhenica]